MWRVFLCVTNFGRVISELTVLSSLRDSSFILHSISSQQGLLLRSSYRILRLGVRLIPREKEYLTH
jgi:hypothetical protein